MKRLSNDFDFTLNENQSKSLIDSLQINQKYKVYLYQYGDIEGIGSEGYGRIGNQVCDCSDTNANVKGYNIHKIYGIQGDTIFIEADSLKLLSNITNYKIILKKNEYEFSQKRNFKRINFSDICK